MTTIQSTTAKAPVSPKKRAGEGCHAFVQNGAIHLLRWGRVERVTRSEAVSALSQVDGSPFPTSQERARQIRAALKETMQ